MTLYILSAQRTPVGSFLGALKSLSATELGMFAAKAALEEAQIDASEIVHSIFGNVCSASSPDGPYLARHIALRAGVPQSVGALNVNRLCGSGFEAILQAGSWVSQGPCLVGGAESMSKTPLFLRDSREGWKFAQPPQAVDSLWEALHDQYAGMHMGQTAENLAQEYSISREECDQWALRSHQKAAQAEAEGLFKKELIPLSLKKEEVRQDEHIRHDTSMEKLSKLRPVFGGVTTAGNASGMNDAAAALVVSDESYAKHWMKQTGQKPLAKVVSSKTLGCDPKRMGIGPVHAIEQLLGELKWSLNDVDYVEINEAFAAQILAVKKALKVKEELLNPHGSGISLGHPLGATGARISTHIAHSLGAGLFQRAIGAACIGGGQGIALAFEGVDL